MRTLRRAAALLSLGLLAACDPAPVPAPPAAAAQAAPAAADDESPGAPARPAARKPGLPTRPKDEATRLAALVRLLEAGDRDLVEFAQGTIADFPDPQAAAAALHAAAERSWRVNIAFVFNLVGCVDGPALARPLEPFLRRCLEVPDPRVRSRAIAAYAKHVEKPSVAVVAEMATDGWSPAAGAAMQALDAFPPAEAAAALRGVYPRISPFARPAACAALGRLGDAASLPLLREQYDLAAKAGEKEEQLRLGAAQGLAALGDPAGTEALRAYVTALPPDRPAVPLDMPRETWAGPEWVLVRTKDPAMKTRLLAQARRAPPEAAAAALRLLSLDFPQDGEIAGAVAAAWERTDGEFLLPAEALAAMHAANPAAGLARTLASLESPEVDRRYAAALALGRFRDPKSAGPLADRLAKEKDPAVGRKICDALGLVGDPSAAPALVRYLRSDPEEEPERALFAHEARVNLRGPVADAAAEELAAVVRGPGSRAIRYHAARALGQSSRADVARPPLEAMLRDPSPALRAAAADALGALGDPAARDALAGAYAREADEEAARTQRDAIVRIDLRNRP